MTHRVCRSTLAAESSHLANAVEMVHWTAAFLRVVLDPKTNLKDWMSEIPEEDPEDPIDWFIPPEIGNKLNLQYSTLPICLVFSFRFGIQ